MTETSKLEIKTFGCKVNTYDSGLLQQRFKEKGFSGVQDKDIHVLNTCAVTAEATKEALRSIRQIKRKNPSAFVVVTGCSAQVDTDSFTEETGADLVVANSHKGNIEDLILKKIQSPDATDRVFKSNIFEKDELESGGGLEEGRTRAFLKIQDGCNSFCTYCVIPFARGKSRSIAIPKLVDKVNELYSKGYREVVITGIHIGDYASTKLDNDQLSVVSARGRKNPDRYYFLEDLVEQLLEKTDMPRFRLSSLEPQELSPRLLELYNNPRMCPHFHMSIQSANSSVLAGMKRKYDHFSVETSLESIDTTLDEYFVGMDVIAGFPGETEEQFEDTFKRLEKLPWTRIHVFPYSDRPGTKAIDYDNKVHQHIRVERAKRLRALSTARFNKMANNQIGKTKKALLLTKYKTGIRALSRDYWQIQIQNPELLEAGFDETKEYKVKVTGYNLEQESRMDGILFGEICFE
ncbi:MAG: tRNA (N(6)-L-threonylcarbamoyladenosine(37)-C(2))-methylthiotransferase MtaB [Bdellovibrionales bacterium]